MAFFRNFFGGDDEYYEEENTQNNQTNQVNSSNQGQQENQNRSNTQSSPLPSMFGNRRNNDTQQQAVSAQNVGSIQSRIALFEPKVYSDAKNIASQLMASEAAILNLTSIDEIQARRVVDFVSGAAYALDGEVERIGDKIFLVTPNSYQITGSLSANLTPEDRY